MSTMLTSDPIPAPGGQDADRPRARIVKLVWLSVLVVAIVGLLSSAFLMLAWMTDETHFDRPSQEFDELENQVENLPGVSSVDTARWVEAPTFSNPTSWISVTVDEAGVPALLEAACSTDYSDAVTWSILVRTPAAAEVSLRSTPTSPSAADDDSRCPDFGFDALRLIDELDRVAPRLAVQPTRENGRFALGALEDETPTGLTDLLPLIEHADDLLRAAGLGANENVEINSANLGLLLEPGEGDRYLAMLTGLAEHHAVSSYWADDGRTIDGSEEVQVVAPDQHHAAIETIIRSSGLHIADLPLRFLEQ